ncbi:unnamed protein product, partial [Trichobilharzia regenti]
MTKKKKKKKKGKSNKKMHKKNKKTKLTTGLSDSDESPTQKAIHSAAAVAEGNINSNKNNNNNANGEDNDILSTSHLCLASTAQTEISSEVVRQRACIAYLLETSTFLSHIQTAIKDFQAMLSSKTLTDVTEAIEFFVVAKQAGIKGLEQGIRLLLALIWSQEE